MPTANPNTKPYKPCVTASANTGVDNWVQQWNTMIKESDELYEKRKREDKMRLSLKRKDLFDRKKQQRRLS